MKYLLDTHTLLWFINSDAQMSANARTAIEDMGNEISVSVTAIAEDLVVISADPKFKSYQDHINVIW